MNNKIDIEIDPKNLYMNQQSVLNDNEYKKYRKLMKRVIEQNDKYKNKFRSLECVKCKKFLCFEKYIGGSWRAQAEKSFYCKTCRQIEEVKK